MINQQFGVYLVLEKDLEMSVQKKRIYWKCRCQKCGNIISVRDDNLMRNSQSCPKCKNDITNQRFDLLTALYRTRIDKNGHAYWMCQCDCGNQKEIAASNLKQGYTKSCGCLHSVTTSQNITKDLTGQKFGKLTVISRVSKVGEGKIKWLCKCDCGTETIVDGSNLKNGHTCSCGCIRSKGELRIREILISLNIKFLTEYRFSDLPNRRFDFYLPDYNLCLEYDGKQHYQYVETWHQTLENYIAACDRDQEKNKYCYEHNMPLVRISYQDYDKLNEEYIKQILSTINTEEVNNEN